MALGPGKYDDACTQVRIDTNAHAVLLLVLEGTKGSGFSLQVHDMDIVAQLPTMLRNLADQIEADGHWEET